MRLSDFDYELPEELIAQRPAAARDASRLLVLPAGDANAEHRQFAELPALLPEGALLVVNDARVIPARVRACKPSGGEVELFFLEAEDDGRWRCLIRGGKLPAGIALTFLPPPGRPAAPSAATPAPAPSVIFHGRDEDGTALVSDGGGAADMLQALMAWGELPLPPYIVRDHGVTTDDHERYQTVFARTPGAVAAPTAGLHFSPAVLAGLAARGVDRVPVTLHVGFGTFAPVRDDDLTRHVMHEERYDVPAATAAAVSAARAAGRPVVAVGTTVVRCLESAATTDGDKAGSLRVGAGRTRLFITPGFRFRVVDHLVTNFHLPKSTLLLLVAAFAGQARVLAAYRDAVAYRYRFFSYGDAMLLGRGARQP